jgi:serine/threonine-protein kinase RsbW
MREKTLGVRLPSELGWERAALDFAARVARRMGFPPERVDDLTTALNEAIANAIEHGNDFDAGKPVQIVLVPGADRLEINVRDRSTRPFPPGFDGGQTPDIDQVIAGQAPVRGWGSFLIRQLVDEARFSSTKAGNVVTMIMRLPPRELLQTRQTG